MIWYAATLAANRTAAGSEDERARVETAQPRKLHPPFQLGRLIAMVPALVVLLLWQLLSQHQAISAYLLPAPGDVAHALHLAWVDHSLPTAIMTTLGESLGGFMLGALVALPLGYAVAHSRALSWLFEPYIAMSQALPAVALAPLLVLWLGYGTLPIVVLCALIVFFPITVATVLGLRTLDRDVLDAAAVDGANGWASLWYIKAPLALPSILAGVRAGLTYSITGAVVGEFVVNAQGLGGLIMIARGNLDTPLVFAALLVLALLAAALYGTGRLLELLSAPVEAK
jgi:NitT/TauT family transport system permease protein